MLELFTFAPKAEAPRRVDNVPAALNASLHNRFVLNVALDGLDAQFIQPGMIAGMPGQGADVKPLLHQHGEETPPQEAGATCYKNGWPGCCLGQCKSFFSRSGISA